MTARLKRTSQVGFGSALRKLREARSIRPSDIEQCSREIGALKQYSNFYVSHATLASIESGASTRRVAGWPLESEDGESVAEHLLRFQRRSVKGC